MKLRRESVNLSILTHCANTISFHGIGIYSTQEMKFCAGSIRTKAGKYLKLYLRGGNPQLRI